MSLLAEEFKSRSTDQAKPLVDNTENDKKAEAELAACAELTVNDMASDSALYKSVLESFTWGTLVESKKTAGAARPCQRQTTVVTW